MRKYFFLILLSFFLISCSKSQTEYESVFASEEESFVQTSGRQNKEVVLSKAKVSDFAEESPVKQSDSFESENQAVERKLIKSGYIQLTVNSLEESDVKIEGWTNSFGGYISSSNMYEGGSRYTVKIPAENFDVAMNAVADFGKVRNRSVNVKDVTDQFYDLQGRLETKKILLEKYNQYLKQADKMKDLLEIESQLNSVMSEIESMEGQMKRLSHQISYSTIEISLTAATLPRGIDSYIKTIKWKKLFSNIINLFIKLFVAIIYMIVFGIPLIAFIALLYWLLFG